MTTVSSTHSRLSGHVTSLDLRGLTGRQRVELLGAAFLMLAGMVTESISVGLTSHVGGYVHNPEGQRLVPVVSLLVGGICLAAATMMSVRAFKPETTPRRLGLVILGLLCAGQVGQTTRSVSQLTVLHQFYIGTVSGSGIHRLLTAYWGLVVFGIAAAAFILPLVLAAANALPHKRGPHSYQRAVQFVAKQWPVLLLAPVGSLAIAAICALLPTDLSVSLGYSAPTFSGGRLAFPVTVLNTTVWSSFGRLSFLPLVVGMWEGMESARASNRLATRLRARTMLRVDYRPLVVVAAVLAIALTIIMAEPLLVPAAVLITGLVTVGTADLGRRVTATKWLGTTQSLGFSKEWRDAAPIGRVLLVLAAPALVPFGTDLWRGLSAPLRLPSDAGNYISFWRSYGIYRVPTVSIDGIFVHIESKVAQVAVGVIAIVVVAFIFNAFVTHEKHVGWRKAMWTLVPVAATAAAFGPVFHSAAHPEAAAVIAVCAIPAILLADKSPERDDVMAVLVVALAMLGLWCYVVWHYDLVPPFAVLLVTIIWRFVVDAKEINKVKDPDARFRRVAAFSALALLGLGMLALGRGGMRGVFPGEAFAQVSDRIAVAVVAPIWLVHIVVNGWVKQTSTNPRERVVRRTRSSQSAGS